MKAALERRGDWTATKCQCCKRTSCRTPSQELLARLRSPLPEEIGRRQRAAFAEKKQGNWEGVSRPRTVAFGLLARLAALDNTPRTREELMDLVTEAYEKGWMDQDPHSKNGAGYALYDGWNSIKELLNAPGGDADATMQKKKDKRFNLTQSGLRLANAYHLLVHDPHRIGRANLCDCATPPQPDPNSVFDDYFRDDPAGFEFETDGKRKVTDTDAAAPAPKRKRKKKATGGAGAAAAAAATAVVASRQPAAARAAVRVHQRLSDGDDGDELLGWDVASDDGHAGSPRGFGVGSPVAKARPQSAAGAAGRAAAARAAASAGSDSDGQRGRAGPGAVAASAAAGGTPSDDEQTQPLSPPRAVSPPAAAAAGAEPEWSCELEGKFQAYDEEKSTLIETAYGMHTSYPAQVPCAEFTQRGQLYRIEFSDPTVDGDGSDLIFRQVNAKDTRRVRRVRRRGGLGGGRGGARPSAAAPPAKRPRPGLQRRNALPLAPSPPRPKVAASPPAPFRTSPAADVIDLA